VEQRLTRLGPLVINELSEKGRKAFLPVLTSTRRFIADWAVV
jgi:hypothetical protein